MKFLYSRDYRHDPNVLYLHYANVRKDLKGSVEMIADFIGVELSPEELDIGKSNVFMFTIVLTMVNSS